MLNYILISGAHTHLPALLMLNITRELDLPISVYTLCLGIGSGVKAVLLMFYTGGIINHNGPQRCAIITTTILAVFLAFLSASTRVSFVAFLVAMVITTGFAETPCFVVLLATHFDALASFATATIMSAFSFAGALLPLAFAPVVGSHGWRAVFGINAVCCVIILPVLHRFLKPGPLTVGRNAPTAVPVPTSAPVPVPVQRAGNGEAASTRMEEKSRPSPAAGGGTVKAFRSFAFGACWLSTFLHLLYGSLLSIHLITVLQTGAGCDVATASAINAVQFGCAIGGKMGSGALLSVRNSRRAEHAVRLLLFIVAPFLYAGSHFLLLDIGGGGCESFVASLMFTKSTWRLYAYAVMVGLPFGMIFGTLQCLPARLFGRQDLPAIQSATYSAILAASAIFGPLVGLLRDAFGGYQVPLIVTFCASCMECVLLAFLMRADATAQEAVAMSYENLEETII